MAAAAFSTTHSSKCLTMSITVAFITISTSAAAISVYFWRRKSRNLYEKVLELEKSLKGALESGAAERRGRIRAQQELRTALTQPKSAELEMTAYPMTPIGLIQSCFSTRNGTPRQPLVVPLARARLTFDSSRVPPASLEGLDEYSHCWIIYVFHLNTDLDKLWKHPSKSRFKAKVRVPRLEGEKKGVFATRSPHRPCPIGLTVAKVEEVHGGYVLLSGVDLVDGTPVLDVKPYLPYCDGIQGATVPKWVQEENLLAVASVKFSDGFFTSLTDCWSKAEKKSLYASADEFQNLIRQVLSWDIRSVSQRSQPHHHSMSSLDTQTEADAEVYDDSLNLQKDNNHQEDESSVNGNGPSFHHSGDIVYHLILEGLDVSYRITDSNVLVERVSLSSSIRNSTAVSAISS